MNLLSCCCPAKHSFFLLVLQNMHVRVIGDSNLRLNVRVNDCLSPVMKWRLIQGVTMLSPNECRDRLLLTAVT